MSKQARSPRWPPISPPARLCATWGSRSTPPSWRRCTCRTLAVAVNRGHAAEELDVRLDHELRIRRA